MSSEYREDDAAMFLASTDETFPAWRVQPILREYVALRQAQTLDVSGIVPEAFAALRAGRWELIPDDNPVMGPKTAIDVCAICGPLAPGFTRRWCRYNGLWWVFCLQCCDTWRGDGCGNGPSKVAQLLEQALRRLAEKA